jgi:recombination protein RecT
MAERKPRTRNLQDKAVAARTNAGTGLTIIDQLKKHKDQLGEVLPSHLTKEIMFRMVTTEIRKTPKLGMCTEASFFGAVYDCASMGLMPGPLGHIYLIPYGTTCTLVIGYKGLLELVYRSGVVETIHTVPVHENDVFKQILGLNPDIIHEPAPKNRGDMTHVYAVAHLKGSDKPRFEVMDKEQIDGIMKRSAAARASQSPWKTDYIEMARKTVLRRLCKTLPLSAEVAGNINKEERVSRYVPEVDSIPIDSGSVYDVEPDDDINDEPAKTEEIPDKVDTQTGEVTEEGGEQPSLLDD